MKHRSGLASVNAGVPDLLRQKWNCLRDELQKVERLPPFHNVVFEVGLSDETVVAPALKAVATEVAGQVEVGSYPVSQPDLSLESDVH